MGKRKTMFFIDKPRSDKPTTILLKTYIPRGGRFVYSTGESILPAHWSKQARRPIPARGTLGAKLSFIGNKLTKIENIYNEIVQQAKLDAIPLTAEYLRNNLDKKIKGQQFHAKKCDLGSLVGYHIEARRNDPKFSPKSRYIMLQQIIKDFSQAEKRLFYVSDINNEWYYNFLNHLYSVQKYTDNTAGTFIAKLKCVLHWAKKEKLIDAADTEAAISSMITIKREVEKVSLTFEEIELLERADFSGHPSYDRVRDLFLIGCYSGQRFSDYSVFDKSDYRDGMIYKIAEKTEITSYIPVDANPPLKRLLEKYDWKLPKISNQKFNSYIKIVAEYAGITTMVKQTVFRGKEHIEKTLPKYKLIGSHTARRTFITLTLQSSIDQKSIMKITGIRKADTLFTYNQGSIEQLKQQIERFNAHREARKKN